MRKRLASLILFAIAFAYVEAAVVLYLRLLLGYESSFPPSSYTPLFDLKFITFVIFKNSIFGNDHITAVETLRESATMVMLAAAAYLSSKNFKQSIAAFLIAFSTWDIFYYVFLKILANWPKTLSDIDIYFLIPVPWIGPVVTPLFISLLLLILGVRLFIREDSIGRDK